MGALAITPTASYWLPGGFSNGNFTGTIEKKCFLIFDKAAGEKKLFVSQTSDRCKFAATITSKCAHIFFRFTLDSFMALLTRVSPPTFQAWNIHHNEKFAKDWSICMHTRTRHNKIKIEWHFRARPVKMWIQMWSQAHLRRFQVSVHWDNVYKMANKTFACIAKIFKKIGVEGRAHPLDPSQKTETLHENEDNSLEHLRLDARFRESHFMIGSNNIMHIYNLKTPPTWFSTLWHKLHIVFNSEVLRYRPRFLCARSEKPYSSKVYHAD